MNDSISDLLGAGREDPTSGEVIHMLHRDRLKPDEDQDRDDWDSPATIANIESIRKSSQIKLDNGRYYGIRNPLWITEADEDGKHTIIAGECRWRSTEDAPDEVQMLPCIIRKGSKKELRLDHTAENGSRLGLNLWQTARSIKRDKEEFDLSTEEIIAVHGLTSKTQLSKFNAIHKLREPALELVKAGYINDVNLVYELRELPDEAVGKLAKRLHKGDSFSVALKAVTPKKDAAPKKGKSDNDQEGGQGSKVSESETLAFSVSLEAARALAEFLDVPTDLEPSALKAALTDKIASLAPVSESDNEGEQQ